MVKQIDYLADIREFHQHHVTPFTGQPKGCTPDEIEALEESFGCELPAAYRQYLAWMGKDYDGIFVGSDWFITNVAENTRCLPELLRENGVAFILPEQYVCFFAHQGYIAAWFELPSVDENPAIWFYQDGMKEPEAQGRFTDLLFTDMRGMAGHLSGGKGAT